MDGLSSSDVKKLIHGDMAVMEDIYNMFFGQVLSYSMSYVIDQEQAFEITQDTFVYLWEKHASISEDSNIKFYLLRIARNKCLNYLKKLKIERNYLDTLLSKELRINYESLKDKTAEMVLLKELSEIIAETIESLPEPCREVFEMSRGRDMTYQEIALKLGISEKMVEYRMMQTLRIFRKNLKPYLPHIIALLALLRH